MSFAWCSCTLRTLAGRTVLVLLEGVPVLGVEGHEVPVNVVVDKVAVSIAGLGVLLSF